MLILARAPQDGVVAALGPVDADVGPTAPSGLTAVWCSGPEPIRALSCVADVVAVWDEPRPGTAVLHLSHAGRRREQVWPHRPVRGGDAPADRACAELAADLEGFFGAPGGAGLVDGLAAVDGAESLTHLLEDHFDLPQLDPVRRAAVTVHRGRSSDVRQVHRVAADAGHRVAATDAGAGWTVLVADDPRVQHAVTAACAGRRSVVLHLWRGDASASGFELAHRRHVLAQGGWDDGWRRPADEDWPARDAAADLMARRVGGNVDLPALRSLLRARTRSADPLARLLALLDVPARALDVLDQGAAQLVAPGNPACRQAS